MKKIRVIQNTHWDYEWYFTNEQSTVLFEFFMKELLNSLENDLIDYFILDGQMGIVEKYLKSYPEDAKRIKKLNEEGKLSIGPWFTQTDQMIISQESIIRNLLLGHKIAKPLGGAWKMAYVPDAFGQSANMPKIYNGFNIDKMVFWRGLSDSKSPSKEIQWVSGKSKVKALNIPEGYYAGGAIYWATPEYLDESLMQIEANSVIDEESVISLGGDQRYVDLDVKDKLAELNKVNSKYEFILGKYEDYFKLLEGTDLPIVEGEMLDSQDSKIHRSIYSHRYDHKYLNDKIERLLTDVVEPLAVIASGIGIDSHLKLIENAWRLLLLNSAHDSAGGCNSDITNEHILNRFKRAEEITTSYIDIVIRKISETAYEEDELVLFNTNHFVKEEWKGVKVISKTPGFNISCNGNINYDVIDVEKVYSGSINRNEKDNDPELYYYKTTINFNHKVNPLSFTSIKVIENENQILPEIIEQNYIENEFFKIEFINGKINIHDKRNNTEINDFISLYSTADDGDTYDFSPLQGINDNQLSLMNSKVKALCNGETRKLILDSEIKLHADLKSWEEGNINLKQNFKLIISLENDFVRVKIKTNNKVKDSRIRISINTGINFSKVNSNIHFGYISREKSQPEIENWKELGWKEEPTGIYPLLSNLYVKNEKQMNIMVNGIKEYEVINEKKIDLTLYRTIGWLGKPDLQRRPGKASGQEFKYVETPDSQLIGQELKWEIGINFNEISESEISEIHKLKFGENVYYQNQELDRFTGPLKYFVSNKWEKEIEKDFSLFKNIEFKDNIELSIIKSLENGDILLRYFNHSDHEIEHPLTLELPKPCKVYDSNLMEEYISEIESDNEFGFKSPSIDKNEIKTIIIKRRQNGNKE